MNLKLVNFLSNEFPSFDHPLSISTDTRNLKKGDVYLALRGSNFDGHDFIEQALEAGCSGVISEEDFVSRERIIQVESTLNEYHRLANKYRKLLNPITIGITGSSGKTTTKELLKLILSSKYKVHASAANFNNEIGVPKTILEMPEDTEVLIIEMGMRGLKEIKLLSQTAEPNIAIITNIGHAHIERLGSIDKIKEAKLEIAWGLNPREKLKATLIIDSKLQKQIKDKKNIEQILNAENLQIEQILSFDDQEEFAINCFKSQGLISDINACVKAAQLLGLSHDQIQNSLLKYEPEKGRGNLHYLQNNNVIIDDSYNANPESVRNAILALLANYPSMSKTAIIGDIYESDEGVIQKVFDEFKNKQDGNFSLLDARGLDHEVILEKSRDLLKKARQSLLFKASRKAALDKVIQSILDEFQ